MSHLPSFPQHGMSHNTPVFDMPGETPKWLAEIMGKAHFSAQFVRWFNAIRTISSASGGSILSDTRANRSSYSAASPGVYFETDAGSSLMYRAQGGNWVYSEGVYESTLAGILTGLGPNDAGLLQWVTDYSHMLQWNGTTWGPSWGRGNPMPSGLFMMFEEAPVGDGASAWQLVNGATVNRLNSDGTVTGVTLDDLTSSAYLKGGITSAPVAAAAGAVANESSHSHSINPPNTISLNNDDFIEVQSGTGQEVAAEPHTHQVNIASFNSSAGTAHGHTAGTLELRRLQKMLYYRR